MQKYKILQMYIKKILKIVFHCFLVSHKIVKSEQDLDYVKMPKNW